MFYSFAKFEKLFRKNPHLLTILRGSVFRLMKRSIKLWNSANTDLKKHCIHIKIYLPWFNSRTVLLKVSSSVPGKREMPYFELRLESVREVSAIRFIASFIFSPHPKKSYQVMSFWAANTHIPGER